MRLTRLNIEHFRGITSMEIAFERDVTVLIGENNSGKTSVLEAIRFGLDSIKSNKNCDFSEFDFQRSSPESILAESPEILFTFSFEETEESRWSDDILRILDPVIVGDEFSAIKLMVKGWFDIEQSKMCQDWTFLDDSDNANDAGQKYIDAAKAFLNGRTEGDLITKLKSSNIEINQEITR